MSSQKKILAETNSDIGAAKFAQKKQVTGIGKKQGKVQQAQENGMTFEEWLNSAPMNFSAQCAAAIRARGESDAS